MDEKELNLKKILTIVFSEIDPKLLMKTSQLTSVGLP